MTHKDARSLIRYAVVVTALTVLVAWTLYRARVVLLLVYISILFAIGMSPLVQAIQRQRLLPIGSTRIPRWLAILGIYVAVLAALTLVSVLVVPPLVQQAQELSTTLPEKISKVQQMLIRSGILDHEITVREAVQRSPVSGGDAVGTVLGAVTSVVGGVFGVVTVLILAFYLLVEGEHLRDVFVRLLPAADRDRGRALAQIITGKVSAWLVGQLVLGGIIAVTAGAGLWAMGVPYFYVLAVIAGIGELIPIVGPILSAVPAILVALTISPGLAIGVTGYYFAQQQLESHLLVPKIMSRQVGVSPVTVIVALLVGGELSGLVGAILAVPSAAILQVLFAELLRSDTASA